MIKFNSNIPAIFIGTTAITILVTQPQSAVAFSIVQINDIAKSITVSIRNLNNFDDLGSGIMISKDNDTYYVLTANHVVQQGTEYEIITPDQQRYIIDKKQIRELDVDTDLAILKFNSNQVYQVAKLSGYDLSANLDSNSKSPVFVAGYPRIENQVPTLSFIPGYLFESNQASIVALGAFEGGYELVYTNNAQQGTSGGPVLDTEGRVIGINGKADGKDQFILGYTKGIPIHTALRVLRESGTQLELRIDNNPPSNLNKRELESIELLLEQANVITEDTNFKTWMVRGNQLYRSGNYEKAIDAFEEALKIQSNSKYAWFAKGLALERLNRYTDARKSFEKAIQIDSRFYQAWRWLGEIEYYLNNYSEALSSFERAIVLEPELYQAWTWKCSLLINHFQKYSEALAACDKAVQLKPSYNWAWNKRGWVLNNLGKYEEALESFDQAIKLKQNSSNDWYGRGWSLNQLKKHDEAIVSLDRGLELSSNNYLIWYQKGYALKQLEKYSEAISSFEEALKIYQEDADVWWQLGLSYTNLKQHKEAINAYNKVIELAPEFDLAWLNKGWSLNELGRFEEAIEPLKKAIDLKSDNSTSWSALAWALYKLERYNESLEAYDQVIKINNDNSYIWMMRGITLHYLGKYDQAIESYDRAIEIDPDYQLAIKNREIARDAQQQEVENIGEQILRFLPLLF